MKNIKIKENKGITLISLVVTIILMIILAGISIVLLFGEQGIITRAKEQKIIQTKAEILDQLELQKTDVLNYDESLYTDLTEYLKHIDGKYLGAYKVTGIIEKEYENGVLVNAKIVVDEKYIYTAAQIENNVVINAVGYIEELDPQIDSFVVTNKTTKTITVEAKVRRAEKYEFYILKDGDWKKVRTETTGNMDTNKQKEVTHEYEGLTSLEKGEKYQFKIVAIRGKRKVEKIIDSEIKDVEIAEGNLIFDIQPTEWTNKEITTKIYKKTDEEGNILKELENLTIQYQINGTEETLTNNSKWIEYKEPIVTDKNIEIWVRLWDGINAGSATTRTITKIDKLAPTGSISVQTTTNSAKVKVSAQDRDATTEDGNSGIKGYYYSKDGGNTYTSITTETSYTFTGLTQSTSLDLKVKVEDNAGNVTEITESGESSSTLKVAELTITVSDSDIWTKTKTITITPKDNNYSKIRYTLNGSTPTTSSTEYTGAFAVNSNCTITAIALDSTNQIGLAATNTVSKIDTVGPTIGTQIQEASQTVNSATVKLEATDATSGLSTIKWYYKTSSQSSYNAAQIDTYTAMNGSTVGDRTEQEKSHIFSSLSCGTTYNIYAEVYDVAGNMTRTPTTGTINVTINHVYETKTTTSTYLKEDATCTTVAVYYYKCNGCDLKGTTTYTNGNELGHNYTSSQNGTKRSDATCTAAATYYDKCTRCGGNASTYHSSGNALGHNYTSSQNGTKRSDATCTAAATYYDRCTRCGDNASTYHSYGSALGHTGNEGGTITQYTSCTADGWRWYRCTRCHQDYSGTYKYENAWGHNYETSYIPWSGDSFTSVMRREDSKVTTFMYDHHNENLTGSVTFKLYNSAQNYTNSSYAFQIRGASSGPWYADGVWRNSGMYWAIKNNSGATCAAGEITKPYVDTMITNNTLSEFYLSISGYGVSPYGLNFAFNLPDVRKHKCSRCSSEYYDYNG